MRVFVAGGTGVLGRRLVPRLVDRGHEVTATTTSAARLGELARLGATGVVMDGLDAGSVHDAVAAARPDVVVHQMTALRMNTDGKLDMKSPAYFEATNRLRTEGTDHLLAAAAATGVPHVVAQSNATMNGPREAGWQQPESEPLQPRPGTPVYPQMTPIHHAEAAVLAAGGAVLRYGWFYGPGATDDQVALVRGRKFPIVGGGTGRWSWIHLEDAASATVLAVEQRAVGVFNVVDDEPAPVSEWLPYLAECAGAKRPMRVPKWLGRLAAGEVAVWMMTEAQGSSNAKAKRVLGWQPRYPSWRRGFREALG
jgi:nucleoside-diphosphate-sugar epimerase